MSQFVARVPLQCAQQQQMTQPITVKPALMVTCLKQTPVLHSLTESDPLQHILIKESCL
jgi:hypothetical protein